MLSVLRRYLRLGPWVECGMEGMEIETMEVPVLPSSIGLLHLSAVSVGTCLPCVSMMQSGQLTRAGQPPRSSGSGGSFLALRF